MHGSKTSEEVVSSNAQEVAKSVPLHSSDVEAMLDAEMARLMREAKVTSYVHIFATRNVAEAVRRQSTVTDPDEPTSKPR